MAGAAVQSYVRTAHRSGVFIMRWLFHQQYVLQENVITCDEPVEVLHTETFPFQESLRRLLRHPEMVKPEYRIDDNKLKPCATTARPRGARNEARIA